MTEHIHLRASGVSLLLDVSGDRLPRVLHWGDDLGPLDDATMAAIATAAVRPEVNNLMDVQSPIGVLAEAALGWMGTPGISGHRDGHDFAPLFVVDDVTVEDDESGGGTVRVTAVDSGVLLTLTLTITVTPSGLVILGGDLRNDGDDTYQLDAFELTLPVPTDAQELLDFTGRWIRERAPQRAPFTLGTHRREGRHGRTGHDATLLLLAGEPGFGFESGRVWGLHVGFSGNHVTYAERSPEGIAILGGGELLLPGEIRLGAGQSYTSPTLYASFGNGMNDLSNRLHRYLRARPNHPRSARPVALNTWEAVYFNHDLDTLTRLADDAAAIGVERFILDDGWFGGRRNDLAGLGDWVVSPDAWPNGLGPLVDHVRGLGMQFGLWFEPEMINPDSDLARAHPDWIMSTGLRTPVLSRQQQVIDLGNPEAFDHILTAMDALITEYAIDYIKWDHNRDLVDAGHPATRRAGVHDQTVAVYALVDELKRRHPTLEIESCASGGARADLGMLERTERIWASDCIDALERQTNQRWTGLLLPPEMMGSHVGDRRAHTTHRTHDMDFRAGTAFFNHFGIEWDISSASAEDRAELGAWVAAYKEHRALLHSGRVVRSDHRDPTTWVHGVVADDGSEAIYAVVSMATSAWSPLGRVTLAGLDPDSEYEVTVIEPVSRAGRFELPEWTKAPHRSSGRVLGAVGLQAPVLDPEQLQLIRAVKVS